MAMFPERYFCSRRLLLPRYDKINRVTCPDLVNIERPPSVDAPALFETAVRSFNASPLLWIAAITVSALG